MAGAKGGTDENCQDNGSGVFPGDGGFGYVNLFEARTVVNAANYTGTSSQGESLLHRAIVS